MSEKLGSYLCSYMQSRVGVFKKYILAAFGNKGDCIFYLESNEGMMIPSSDRKNCELLRDAGLFLEDTRISRNGRNTYKFYCLTESGKKMAEILRAEKPMTEDQEEMLKPTTSKKQR
jgi:hypothetical protein